MASGVPVATPVTEHDTAHDEENIPVAQAFVPGAHPSYQYAQATPVVAQPAGGIYTATPAYNAAPVSNYPQYETGKVPPTPPTPGYAPTPYSNFEQSGKPVAAGAVRQQASPKCLGLPRKVFFLIIGLIILVIVGVGVGVGVAASGGGDDKKSSGTNSPPGSTPVNPSTPVTETPPAPGSPPGEIPIVTVGGATAPTSPSNPGTNPTPPSNTPRPPSATSSPPVATPSPPVKTTAPAPPSSGSYGTLTSDGQSLVTAINQVRQKNGVSALTVDSTLVCTAQRLSRNKGGQSNPTCTSEGFPLATRISQCDVTFNGQINQLTGCEYYTASYQVDSWASDSSLSKVLLNSTFQYVGGDGYHNGKFWTAIFA